VWLLSPQGTFTAAQLPPRHPTKPHLTPEVVLPIFPDAASWSDKYVTVHFEEGDPAQDSKTLAQVGHFRRVACAACGG
jgi:hypothetical protein